ncbi:class I SAM-dependent methyltransferase [Deltaproteobacteria bacterium OttesenSCG-928-K17]|nr:class I SAM-dependent methyltransferase [Deltaproteobacteria bacterium OttesenSCG-928-K17]
MKNNGAIEAEAGGGKWPKTFPPLTAEQEEISHDFMKHWHEVLPNKYGLIEKFNHGYPVAVARPGFARTLEIGAGLGEHLHYERLTEDQRRNYTSVDIRENMVEGLKAQFPDVKAIVADCQKTMPFEDGYFDRLLAIHVLEHLPDLPLAVKELHRLCDKEKGRLTVVLPCEGGLAYSLGRAVSAKRIFEKRYKMSYDWFISREHINRPDEIFEELGKFFKIESSRYFPFMVPLVFCNLCIGLNLSPRKQ